MTLELEMITIDCPDPKRLAGFWTGAPGTEVEEDYGEFLFLRPVSGIRIGLQQVSESRATKNRAHPDFRTEDRPAEVARLVRLGARELAEHSVPGLTWTVPGGPGGQRVLRRRPDRLSAGSD